MAQKSVHFYYRPSRWRTVGPFGRGGVLVLNKSLLTRFWNCRRQKSFRNICIYQSFKISAIISAITWIWSKIAQSQHYNDINKWALVQSLLTSEWQIKMIVDRITRRTKLRQTVESDYCILYTVLYYILYKVYLKSDNIVLQIDSYINTEIGGVLLTGVFSNSVLSILAHLELPLNRWILFAQQLWNQSTSLRRLLIVINERPCCYYQLLIGKSF